eukprot:353018-Pyramimonas_sp.AAC.1
MDYMRVVTTRSCLEIMRETHATSISGTVVHRRWGLLVGTGLTVSYGLGFHYWGDWGSDQQGWAPVVYMDGSGLAPGLPEITRCGWGF